MGHKFEVGLKCPKEKGSSKISSGNVHFHEDDFLWLS